MAFDKLVLRPTADFHVHLRDGPMMELVVPTIEAGGCDTVYVMPNLQPPLTNVSEALAYKGRIEKSCAIGTTILMTLYLHPDITPAVVADAARQGIAGIKAYPRGQTTGSQDGVLDYEAYWPVFAAMQEHDLVLNLHGEAPITSAGDMRQSDEAVTVLNAEIAFLPILHKIHEAFPRLRIVLEHCTTREAINAVKACGPTVAATITAHHLWLSVNDWCNDAFNFCKPVAKHPADRRALIDAVFDPSHKFFFGSDSAPHPIASKISTGKPAAGCFTQPYVTQLVVGAIEEAIRLGWIQQPRDLVASLENFLRLRGRMFYHLPNNSQDPKRIIVTKLTARISEVFSSSESGLQIVPFRAGQPTMSLKWDHFGMGQGEIR